jgi:hypothetical protein
MTPTVTIVKNGLRHVSGKVESLGPEAHLEPLLVRVPPYATESLSERLGVAMRATR